jgi:hypothetical protein
MATNSSVKKIITIEVQGNQAKASIDGVTMSTKQLNQELERLSRVGGKTPAGGGTTGASGGATATVLELGRTISDSNYGIRGMANNLSQLASNLVFTTRAAGGLAAGFKDIWAAMMGPLGLILVFQGVIALLERFSMQTDNAKDSVDALEKEVKELNKTLKDEIKILRLYEDALMDTNTTLEERLGIVKGLSVLDKDLAKELKKANGNRRIEARILKDLIEEKELELKIATKKVQIEEALDRLQKARNNDLFDAETKTKLIAMAQGDVNRLFTEYLLLLKDLEIEEEKQTQKKKEKVDFGDTGGVFWTVEDYNTAMELDMEQRRRYIESRRLFYDELKIQASEANNDILRDEIQHREDMLVGFEEGSIQRLEAEHEISMLRMDLVDREFEHEMLLLDLKMQAQMEYIDFLNGMGRVFARIQSDNEKIQQLGIIMQKGAAIAGIVIETSRANQEVLASSVSEIGFYRAAGAARSIIGGPAAAAPFLAMAETAKASAAKRILLNNIGAGISIANILAANMKSKGGARGLNVGGRETGGEGGGRTFDFNLVGTTGTNQLAEAVGAQFQEPIQAFVVSSQITSQQELDLEISTGASLGD